MGKKSQIFSISGQIETVAAEVVIKEHGLLKIMPWDFPEGVAKFDEAGRPVAFAVMMNDTVERQFDKLVATLRA